SPSELYTLSLHDALPILISQVTPDMAYVNCNLCGADDFSVVFPKGYAQLHRIVRCKRCNLMYANPQELIDCVEFSTQDDLPFGEDRKSTRLNSSHDQISY